MDTTLHPPSSTRRVIVRLRVQPSSVLASTYGCQRFNYTSLRFIDNSSLALMIAWAMSSMEIR
ncbi:MAG: hypothetical protein KGZ72_05215, partial [Roseovarius sp.]|nr:hypothetical protein [Roseovarius sp.]